MKKPKDESWTKLSTSISYRLLPGTDLANNPWSRLQVRWRNSSRIWQGLMVTARLMAWRLYAEQESASLPITASPVRCGIRVLPTEGWLVWVDESSVKNIKDVERRLLAMEDGPPFRDVLSQHPIVVFWDSFQSQLFQDVWEPSFDMLFSTLQSSTRPIQASSS